MAQTDTQNEKGSGPEVLIVEEKKQENPVAHGSAMDFINSARNATEKEHKMTLLQGIKTYPKAIAWSMLISTCIVMEGYDVCLINNFCASILPPTNMLKFDDTGIDAFPQFNRKYGEQLPSGEWQVPARWQAGLSNVSLRKLYFL